MTTIAGVFLGLSRYDRRRVDGLWMSSEDVSSAVSSLRNMTYDERARNGCIGAGRADLVLAGCAILEAIRRAFPAERVRIADRGLREGILMQLIHADRSGARSRRRNDAMTETKAPSGREGGRSLKTRVKTARKRTLSSTLWLQRQLNDPYVARGQAAGFPVPRGLQADRDRRALSFSQTRPEDHRSWRRARRLVAGRRERASARRGRIIGIDLLEIEPMPGAEFKVMDFLDEDAPRLLMEWLGGKADVVLSDMAANATGHKKTDHLRIIGLVELAADFACRALAPGGSFLAKVFQGGTENELLAGLKRDFAVVRHVKPQASRADSSELYVLATGFRGRAES